MSEEPLSVRVSLPAWYWKWRNEMDIRHPPVDWQGMRDEAVTRIWLGVAWKVAAIWVALAIVVAVVNA